MRAVCFDLDGVLIHSMPLHARAWQQAGTRFGLRVSARAIYACEGEPGAVTARLLLRQHGRTPSAAAIAELLKEKERRFSQPAGRLRVHPLLARWIHDWRRRVPIALVTGTSRPEVRRAVPARIRRAFDAIITGDRVRHGKPHPEPYRTAFRRLRIAAGETIVVENAPYGIRSAKAAGAGYILALASSLPRRFLQEADQVVGSVPALCAALDARLARHPSTRTTACGRGLARDSAPRALPVGLH